MNKSQINKSLIISLVKTVSRRIFFPFIIKLIKYFLTVAHSINNISHLDIFLYKEKKPINYFFWDLKSFDRGYEAEVAFTIEFRLDPFSSVKYSRSLAEPKKNVLSTIFSRVMLVSLMTDAVFFGRKLLPRVVVWAIKGAKSAPRPLWVAALTPAKITLQCQQMLAFGMEQLFDFRIWARHHLIKGGINFFCFYFDKLKNASNTLLK